MAHGADVARGTHADATWHARPRGRGARAHAARRWCTNGADTCQGPRESTRMPGWCHVVGGLEDEGPTG